MSKQTAVEWLYEEITKKSVNDPNHNVLLILKQAKEMENQQMYDAHVNGVVTLMDFEEYYQAKYGTRTNANSNIPND
jgi:hypothetical protein